MLLRGLFCDNSLVVVPVLLLLQDLIKSVNPDALYTNVKISNIANITLDELFEEFKEPGEVLQLIDVNKNKHCTSPICAISGTFVIDFSFSIAPL